MGTAVSRTTPAEIILVEAPACHLCEEAKTALRQIGATYPLTITLVAATSAVGRELIHRHRAPMAPLVLLDGSRSAGVDCPDAS